MHLVFFHDFANPLHGGINQLAGHVQLPRQIRRPHAVNKTNVTDIRTATRDRAAIVDSDAIHRMISDMPDGIASAFLLVSIEGHGYQQAGDIMGVAPTLIMSQLAQAKMHFASLADDHSHRF